MTLRARLPVTQELTIPLARDTLAIDTPQMTMQVQPVTVTMTTVGVAATPPPPPASMSLPAGFASRIGISAAEATGMPPVTAGSAVEPMTMGGGNEGQPEGVDQGYWEGTDQEGGDRPMNANVTLGGNGVTLPTLPTLGEIGLPSNGLSLRSPTVDTDANLPQLQAVALPSNVIKNIAEAPPAPITDLGQYRTSVQTQKLIKYALIAGVVGLVVWYFFFRGNKASA